MMRAARTAVIVMLAGIGSIAVAWLLASFVPDPILGETLARTSRGRRPDRRPQRPGRRAYATVRTDVSNSLPGRGRRGAGSTSGDGRHHPRAGSIRPGQGAALLYTTNLVAIVLAGILVFLATGFVPRRRLAHALPAGAARNGGSRRGHRRDRHPTHRRRLAVAGAGGIGRWPRQPWSGSTTTPSS
ncbi:MAG: hypothetical protein R2705_03110 [Ilumatobacteraceae bacterium]